MVPARTKEEGKMANNQVNPVIDGKSKNRNLNPVILTIFAVLMLYTIVMFIILGWGLLTSIKSTMDFKIYGNVLGFPDYSPEHHMGPEYEGWTIFDFLTKNYTQAFKIFKYKTPNTTYYSAIWGEINVIGGEVTFINFVINSIVYAVIGSIIQVFTCMTTAFMCCKYRYKFSYFIYTMLLVVMTIPIIGSGPSTIQVLYDLGIYDTYIAMFIMSANMSGMYFFVYFAFFQGLSDTYIEAAEIDGSSQLMTYIRIVVPLAMNMAGTVILIVFITLWNNYSVPLLYYPTKPTLAYAIYKMNENTTNTGTGGFFVQSVPQKVAGCMTLALPMIILFVALKNRILGNLSMGGLKE